MTSRSGSEGPERRDAANGRGAGTSHSASASEPVHLKLAVESNYYFEICRNGPRHKLASIENVHDWFWRLLSPAGVTMIECGGYLDEKSCRAAVSLLREKAGTAHVSHAH